MLEQEVELGDLITRLVDYRGKTPRKTESGVKLITAKVIKGGRIVEDAQHEYIDPLDYKATMRRGIPLVGDIIITTEAPLGEVAQIKTDEQIAIAQRVILFTPDPKKVLASFLYYSLLSGPVQERLAAKATGTTVLGISNPGLRSVKIPLPPLPLQRKIAAVLGRYDALWGNYQHQVAALEGLAQEVYKEWFMRGRGPGVAAVIKEELPAGWRTGKLREVLNFYIGGGWGQDEPDDAHTVGGHVVRGTDIPNLKKGRANLDVYRYHKASNMASRELRTGDIVFEVSGGSTDQGLGRNVLITDEVLAKFGNKVMAASFCKLIRPDQTKISPYYLQQLLDHLLATQEMAQFEVQSTGISNFQFEDFIDYQPVIIPAMEAMDRFDKLVSPMYKKIGILSTQMATLRATRDALLPRLLSGQLAVEALAAAEA